MRIGDIIKPFNQISQSDFVYELQDRRMKTPPVLVKQKAAKSVTRINKAERIDNILSSATLEELEGMLASLKELKN